MNQVHVASALLSLGLVALILSTTLSAFGFKGRQHSVGIDLGTTFSVVAVKRNGSVEVIPDGNGRFTTPSVVAYRPEGEIVTGYDALPFLETDPVRTIYNAKRFIGRLTNDSVVVQESPLHPFRVVAPEVDEKAGRAGPVMFSLENNDQGRRSRSSRRTSQLKNRISPEDVGTHILQSLRRIVEAYLGHDRATTTVIAVPADFGLSQKKATRRAFLGAGFSVARIIDEPTAAAVAYGLHKQPNVHHVIVYDLGGGTLDTSLLHIHKGSVQVLLEDGDNHLGGEDFDQAILGIIDDRLRAHDASLDNAKNDHLPSCASRASLKSIAERVKRDLSIEDEAEAACVRTDGGVFRTKITRSEFQAAAQHLFERAMEPIRRVLENASMKTTEIDEVVMVGGSSRIPRIREAVSEFFGGLTLRESINPDLAVAIGAASIVD